MNIYYKRSLTAYQDMPSRSLFSAASILRFDRNESDQPRKLYSFSPSKLLDPFNLQRRTIADM